MGSRNMKTKSDVRNCKTFIEARSCRCLKVIVLFAPMLLISLSYADPVINGISGSVSNASQITISGSGFGNGPQVVFFDDFEGGTLRQTIMTGPGSAVVGAWASSGRPATTYYASTSSVSGQLAFQASFHDNYYSYMRVAFPSIQTDVFMSYWFYLPPGDNAPGEGNVAEGVNWKVVWLLGNLGAEMTHDDDQVIPCMNAREGIWADRTYQSSANDSPYHPYLYTGGGMTFEKGVWKNIKYYIHGATDTTGVYKFFSGESGGLNQVLNTINVQTLDPDNDPDANYGYEGVHVNGYGRTTINCHPTFDDVYVAVGAYAQARIEIGNASTYTASTRLAMSTPNTWSDTRITATVRQGGFSNAESAYLFVIDANGIPSPGYPIIFNSAPLADTIPPNMPLGLKLQK